MRDYGIMRGIDVYKLYYSYVLSHIICTAKTVNDSQQFYLQVVYTVFVFKDVGYYVNHFTNNIITL